MKIDQTKIYSYEIQLKKPLTIAGQTITARNGLVIALKSGQQTGYGEIAPLPGLHRETLEQAKTQIEKIINNLPSTPDDILPTVNFAIESALFDIRRQQNIIPTTDPIKVNALTISNDESIISECLSLIEQGYKTIKIKVARRPVASDIQTITKLQTLLKGKATLRLDANRLWPLETAIKFCAAVTPDNIEYIEEPTKDLADLKDFQTKTNFPIALDETILELSPEDLPQAAAWILKPSLIGSLKKTEDYINLAKTKSITTVITSTFETSITLKTLTLFAAKMNLTKTAHGLATANFLTKDLTTPLKIINGQININNLKTEKIILNENLIKQI